MSMIYGFIGAGNMGSALIRALSKHQAGETIAVSDPSAEKVSALSGELGIVPSDNETIASTAEYVVLAVKPQVLPDILPQLGDELASNDGVTLVTMAAGTSMQTVSDLCGGPFPIIRIMPNTPVSIGAGVLLICRNELVPDNVFEAFCRDFAAAGVLVPLEREELIDVGMAISGCGPAYIYMYIDAMAKAGEKLGLDYETAATLAKATARGSATLSERSDKSLEDLRIAVCSPGGTTIEGVKTLWDDDLDGIVERALKAAYDRSLELSSK
ncbi:MAG: pyrroline-5-carboxylate reductase [Clostridia bacterium]|nr:pyrroline-5-carboxylate reductase [Clostridia bacterium]